ncbi:MAG: uracil-DNA glycosylase [Tannerella sp.]|jgi:uracil-DNA glycosylase|nr:uracil-DNA glycosylase [Tannerella sp.]
MNVKIEQSWRERLSDEFGKAYFAELINFVRDEYAHTAVYPSGNLIFNAFQHCPFDRVKVVLLGQDPYHEPGQAHGLCFSVCDGVPFPPSLVNIFKEIESDLGRPVPRSGDLTRWADQGVLLLNATLTVRAHAAGSHQHKGWETFTDAVIHQLDAARKYVVYMLWGAYAQKKGNFINSSRNLILSSAHPSPLSAHRGFFGNKHFSRANDYLIASGQDPVDW